MTFQQVTADVLAGTAFQGYIGGLTLSNSPTPGTASTTMAMSAGVATDSTNGFTMTIGSFTKTSATWAVNSGNGGLDTGSFAVNTWYHFYLIGGSAVKTDVTFSTNATTPGLPTGYTIYRRIGSMKSNATPAFTGFVQQNEQFWWVSPVLDINNAATSTSAVLTTIPSVPSGIIVEGIFVGNVPIISGTPQQVYISDPAITDQAPSTTAAPLSTFGGTNANTGSMQQNTPYRCFVNTSAQVRIRSSATGSNYYVTTLGWVDYRGRFS